MSVSLSPDGLFLAENGKYRRGSHIAVERDLRYWHHGIYWGWNKVIHHSGWSSGLKKGPVEMTSFEEFAAGGTVYAVRREDSRPWQDVVRAAKDALEKSDSPEWQYSLASSNCEHFANWCITGRKHSAQIDAAKLLLIGPWGKAILEFFSPEDSQ